MYLCCTSAPVYGSLGQLSVMFFPIAWTVASCLRVVLQRRLMVAWASCVLFFFPFLGLYPHVYMLYFSGGWWQPGLVVCNVLSPSLYCILIFLCGTSAPVDGGLGLWTQWGSCSVTCGQGVMRRTRKCDNPPASDGGAGCSDSLEEERICTKDKCNRKFLFLL